MTAPSRSLRPRISGPSPPVEVLPPPVSGPPTGALRVLVGVGRGGLEVGEVVVGDGSTTTGGCDDAEVVAAGLLGRLLVGVVPTQLLQKARSRRTKMIIAKIAAIMIPVRRRLEPDPAVSGALSDIAEVS
jgi:hypothetical protein